MFHFNIIEIRFVHLLLNNDLIENVCFCDMIISGLKRLESINLIGIWGVLLR